MTECNTERCSSTDACAVVLQMLHFDGNEEKSEIPCNTANVHITLPMEKSKFFGRSSRYTNYIDGIHSPHTCLK
jgi:hypothetical protein